jgi:hypothetical protein
MYFVPDIYQVAEKYQPPTHRCAKEGKEKPTIQIQNKEDLRETELIVIGRGNGTDHKRHLGNHGQHYPDNILVRS